MYRITLVIPTYNRAASLMRALESVAQQTLDPSLWECLIIDNASTDDTAEQVAAFAAAHPTLHIRHVVEPKAGVSHARNRALQEATTELICSIDDDERINKGFLEAYLRLFEEHLEVQVAGGRIIAEYEKTRPRWMSRWTERPIANPMDYGEQLRPFPKRALPGGGNMGFRRSVALQFGFATELGRVGGKPIGGEENDFFLRLREAGYTLWYLPEAIMWHIIPPEKLTDEAFRRLAFHIGISQARRARLRGSIFRTRVAEVAKWCATLLLCGTLHPAKWGKLFTLRRHITRGLWHRET